MKWSKCREKRAVLTSWLSAATIIQPDEVTDAAEDAAVGIQKIHPTLSF